MHGTHLPLRTWFIAAHLVATHSNGISALQLQAKLEIGSYKAAWLLLHKLRRAMVDPERDPLEGMIEIDETSIAYRTKDDPGRRRRRPQPRRQAAGGRRGRVQGRRQARAHPVVGDSRFLSEDAEGVRR